MPYIIGTAGHIDHGKTSLIKALTGQDTDRLSSRRCCGHIHKDQRKHGGTDEGDWVARPKWMVRPFYSERRSTQASVFAREPEASE